MMRSSVPFPTLFLILAPALLAQESQSSFGHARTREAAALGRLPLPIEVAVADIVNYHRHRLPLPRDDRGMMLELRFGNTEAAPGDEVVLQFGYTTAPGDDSSDLPPLNLALVIDRSGSMAEANKLDQVKAALAAFVGKLRPADRVALITYDNEPTLAQRSRSVDDARWLRDAIARIETGGGTNLHGGLMLGLREVSANARSDSSNRVLLLTDGIANRGVTDPERILADAREFTAEDVDLSTIGVGRNLDIALLDRLARGGRGLFHYVADAVDVQKVFVEEHEGLVASVARRVQLRFQLPRELEFVRAVGHHCVRSCYETERSRSGDGVTIDLPNQNRGATGVVMVVCRVAGDCPLDSTVHVPGELSYQGAAGQRSIQVDETLTLSRRRCELLRDPEVRKNHTIAVLAEGMHEMARQAECRRWADADRALRRALEFSREQFASDDDVDVARVRRMALDQDRTLQRYVDRFRDN
ncbi:MAG: VWA domain-containing protein [Planctomycetes bacterium]|nr:VWA domain-containing protein [Planctomycetota bacterium]